MTYIKRRLLIAVSIMLMAVMIPAAVFATETGTEATATDPAAAEDVQEPETPRNAVVKENGKLVYYNKKGEISKFTGWKKIGDDKYWADSKGRIAKKATFILKKKKVDGKTVKEKELYIFRPSGKLIVKKRGLYKYKGKHYFSNGDGSVRTGWVAYHCKGKAVASYFSKKTGKMVQGKKVKYLKIPKSGRLGEAYYYGVKQLDRSGWTLRQAYTFSYRLRYGHRWWRQSSAEKYALRGFKYGYGNCYVMASTFYIQAKLLGYDVHQVQGYVGVWPHSWTVIKQKDGTWVYDPNFRNETGRNGWKIWYGKKGTWRYSRMSYMN